MSASERIFKSRRSTLPVQQSGLMEDIRDDINDIQEGVTGAMTGVVGNVTGGLSALTGITLFEEKEDDEILHERPPTLQMKQPLSVHPDTTLRRLGLIQQEGRWGWFNGVGIRYDPIHGWVYSDQYPLKKVTEKKFDPFRAKQRVDKVPNGIIWVIGSLNCGTHDDRPLAQSTTEDGEGDEGASRLDENVEDLLENKKFEELEEMLAFLRNLAEEDQITARVAGERKRATNAASNTGDRPATMTEMEIPEVEAAKSMYLKLTKLATSVKNIRKNKKSARGEKTAADNTHIGQAAGNGHNVIANLGGVETDPRFLSEAEVQNSIRQFFFRSLPNAVMRSESLLVTSCSGDMADVLGGGIAAVNEKTDINALRVGGLDTFINERKHSSKDGHLPLCQSGFTHLLGLTPEENSGESVVKERSVTAAVERLVATLAEGYIPDVERRTTKPDHEVRTPPRRDKVPVVVVVAGGEEAEVLVQLQLAIAKEWPILIIHGSGGFADVLANTVRGATERAEVSEELRRQFTSILSPALGYTVSHGRCIVVPRGEVVDNFTQSIIYALRGDETLRRAWIKFESWQAASKSHALWYKGFMVTILCLGIAATGLSVFLTLAQILWPDETKPSHQVPADASVNANIRNLYDFLNLVVIFLPIAMQLVQTVSNRRGNGRKWAALRYAAESCKREIFMLRSEMGAYGKERVLQAKKFKEAKKSSSGDATAQASPADENMTDIVDLGAGPETEKEGTVEAIAKPTEVYGSRQELLHLRLEALTVELSELISDVTVPVYEGIVPRPESLHATDDGFSDITADEYAELRLSMALKKYSTRARDAAAKRRNMDIAVHALNTTGTLLGALSTYEEAAEYNLQAWVAFTTAIVSALSRFDHWMMIEWSKSKYTQTALNLGTVVSWWASRGNMSGQPKVRNELPIRVESIISAEVQEFRKQLMTAVESSKNAADEMAAIAEEAEAAAAEGAGLSKEQREAHQRSAEMNVGGMTIANIETAIKDPKGMAGRKIKRLMKELNTEFGDPIAKAKVLASRSQELLETANEAVSDFGKVRDMVTDESGCLQIPTKYGIFNFTKFFPAPIISLLDAPHKRSQFLRAAGKRLYEASNIRQADYMEMAQAVDGKVLEQYEKMPTRLQLETVRRLLKQEAVSGFLDSLAAAKLSVYEIVPLREQLPGAIEELQAVARVPWRQLDHQSIVALISTEALRNRLSAMQEPKLRALLKRVEYFFVKDGTIVNLQACSTADAAELDLYNTLLSTRTDRIAVVESTTRLSTAKFNIGLLPKQSLLRFFPPHFTPQLQELDVTVLANIAERLASGMPMSFVLHGAIIKERDEELRLRLEAIFRAPSRTEQFVIMADRMTQREIFSQSKQAILKRLMGLPNVEKNFVDDLRAVSEEDLKRLLCRFRASLSCSYVGFLFDQLSEQVQSLDTHKLFSFEEQILLLNRLKEFRGVDISNFDKSRILKTIGYRGICDRLKDLYGYQLQELIQRLLYLMNRVFTSQVLTVALRDPILKPKQEIFSKLSKLQIDRLVSEVRNLKSEDIIHVVKMSNDGSEIAALQRVLNLIIDHDVRLTMTSCSFTTKELDRFLRCVDTALPDRAAVMLFNDVCNDLTDEVSIGMVDSIMTGRSRRQEFLRWCGALMKNEKFNWSMLNSAGTQSLINLFASVKSMKGLHEKLLTALKPEPYVTFVLCTLQNLWVNTPQIVFNVMSTLTHTFSLSGLVTGVGSRSLFLSVLLDMRDGKWWDAPTNDDASTDTSSYKVTNAAIGKPIKLNDPDRIDMVAVRLFMSRLPTLFDPLVKTLQFLPEAHLRKLMSDTIRFCATSPVMEIFEIIRARWSGGSNEEGETLSSRLSRLDAHEVRIVAVMIEAHVRVKPFDVKQTLHNFDYRSFASKSVRERFEIISKFVTWEFLAHSASRWGEESYRMLFQLIRLKPTFNTRSVEDGASVSDALSHMKHISERSKHMAALNALTNIVVVESKEDPAVIAPSVSSPPLLPNLINAAKGRFMAGLLRRKDKKRTGAGDDTTESDRSTSRPISPPPSLPQPPQVDVPPAPNLPGTVEPESVFSETSQFLHHHQTELPPAATSVPPQQPPQEHQSPLPYDTSQPPQVAETSPNPPPPPIE